MNFDFDVESEDDDILNAPESKCLLDYSEERIKKRRGVIILFTGGTGSGKSYAGLRYLQLWYRKMFDEPFPVKHICENLEQAILIVKDLKRKGEGILIEELSILAGSRDSMTTANKLWNKFVDVVREKQAVIVGNCPHISFIDKHFVMMCNAWVDCWGIDFKRNIVMARPLWLQTSPFKNEPYRHKFISDDGYEIDTCYFRKPDKELSQPYDDIKASNNENLYEEIAMKMATDRINQLKKLGNKVLSPRELEAYQLHLKGYSAKESAENMGLKNEDTFYKYLNSAKNKLKKPEYAFFAKKMQESEKISTKGLPEQIEPAEVNLSGDDFQSIQSNEGQQ